MDHLSESGRSQLMSRIRSRDTKPELVVRSALHRIGYRYSLHVKGLPGTPDLVFPGRGKIIFVSGCFWHGHNCKFGKSRPKSNVEFWTAKIEANMRRDRRVVGMLRRRGWRVMTVWECRIKKGNWIDPVLRFLER